ncbi:MAG: hypothetical protein Q7K57_17145 [Burkholderiaceae bacterium]|nr:hypothetical protein [Burkholderiaceae bacterium]
MTEQTYRSLQQIFEVSKLGGGRGGDLFSTSNLNEPATHLCIYEDADALGLPIIVVPAEDDLENFFADIATYFPERAPISAYIHVLHEATYRALGTEPKTDARRGDDKRELSAYIGLILGDALSALRVGGNQSTLPGYSSCKRTLAYCIARAAVLHPHLSTQEISERWLRIRELSGMDASTNAAASTIWAADIVNGKFSQSNDPAIREFIETLSLYVKKHAKRERVAASLISLYPKLHESAPLLHEAFEKRINAFSAIVNAVRQGSRGSVLDSLCVAFFCNLILPGSLAHSGLIDRLLPDLPDSMLWYGLFAGSSEEFSLTSSVGGVGQKLLRDLVASFDFLRRPTCDLSFDEYDVLARVPLRSEVLKPTQAKAVLVSLYPGVEVYVRSAMEEDDAGDRPLLSSLLLERDERANQVRQLLRQADQLLSGENFADPGIRTRAKTARKPKQSKS